MRTDITEQHLTDSFVATLCNGSWSSHYPVLQRIVTELPTIAGIPDIVGSTIQCQIDLPTHNKIAMTLSQYSSARLFSLLKPKSPRSEDYLMERTGLTRRTVSRVIRELESSGVAVKSNGSGYIVSPEFPVLDMGFWAFELKLHNWKRALYQALRYKAFAQNIAVVLLHNTRRRSAYNLDLFRKVGIGFITFDPIEEQIFTLVAPRRNRPNSLLHRLYATGKFLGMSNDWVISCPE